MNEVAHTIQQSTPGLEAHWKLIGLIILGFLQVWLFTHPKSVFGALVLNTIAPLSDKKTAREFNSRRILTYTLIPVLLGALIRGFFFREQLEHRFTEDEIRVLDFVGILLTALIGIGSWKDTQLNKPPDTQVNANTANLNGPNNIAVNPPDNTGQTIV